MSAQPHRLIVVMGVAGSGKTTISSLLASRLGGIFFDADDFHPLANIEKMAQGIALNDEDRPPWLIALRREVIDSAGNGALTILACSALKRAYRRVLGLERDWVLTVFLNGDEELLAERLSGREGHFMGIEMLQSQLETLEVPHPDETLHVSISQSPDEMTDRIIQALRRF